MAYDVEQAEYTKYQALIPLDDAINGAVVIQAY